MNARCAGWIKPLPIFWHELRGKSSCAHLSWTEATQRSKPEAHPRRNIKRAWPGAGGLCAFALEIFLNLVKGAWRLPLAQFHPAARRPLLPGEFEKRWFHVLHGPVVEPISAPRGGEKNSACCTFACKGIFEGQVKGARAKMRTIQRPLVRFLLRQDHDAAGNLIRSSD